ncbi:HlyD family efflux transporter periplasmic adaptor subunit [Paracoccaceae bacterium]|nr:HlyD family efflux transporter periplasmic adaptor subunit [Paracoccaceae bacterium]
MKNFRFCWLALILSTISSTAFSENNFRSLSLSGTVFANNETSLSYQTSGCIAEVSSQSLTTSKTYQGQILVELDDRNAVLALKTAQARLLDLEASVDDSDFAIEVAKADVGRVEEEFQFVQREFERTKVLFERGLVNETTLEAAERRKLEATFSVQRAKEALSRSISSKTRSLIALDIGKLELEGRQLDLDELIVRAPHDGILLDFEPNIGDCVSQGSLAAKVYRPDEKSVETFIFVEQLVNAEKIGVAVGNSVNVIRTNGKACKGIFSLVGTQADLESQNVKATIDLDPACAPLMFLNEAVKIETVSKNIN